MTNEKTNKKSSKIKWIIGVFISLLAAGGGISELLKYNDDKQRQEFELRQQEDEIYQIDLNNWDNFSPVSLAGQAQTVNLRGASFLNLEMGHVSNLREKHKSDLLFSRGGGVYANEYLRVENNALWSDQGVIDFDKIKYREIRDANYSSPKHPKSGYPDLFNVYGSGVPGAGYVYFIKTSEGNVAKIQIVKYKSESNNPQIARDIVIKYEVFPIVDDPPRPIR